MQSHELKLISVVASSENIVSPSYLKRKHRKKQHRKCAARHGFGLSNSSK